jgi:signal transduction protein with GAF and PtsI domain
VRLARFVEIAVAIGISFWLNSLEKRVETVVESIFFRRRQAAMRRLARSTEAVHNANEIQTVFDFVVREPTEALSLSSAAVFLQREAGFFQRIDAQGWSETTLARIPHDDPLALNLEAEFEPMHVADIGWHPSGLPGGSAAPILAVPLVARRELTGILLYGAHSNGADIDPDEVSAIFDLAKAAQATYDHLRVVELLDEVEGLKAQLAGRKVDVTRANTG